MHVWKLHAATTPPSADTSLQDSRISLSVSKMRDNYYVIDGAECARCTECGEIKPLYEFYTDSRKKYGIRSKCKSCTNADHAKYNAEHPEKNRAYSKRYYQEKSAADPDFAKKQYAKNAEAIAQSTKRWKENVKLSELTEGVRGAKFVSVTCAHCGKVYTVPQSIVDNKKKRIKKGHEPMYFCSAECNREYRREHSKRAQKEKTRINVEEFLKSRNTAQT